MFEPRKADRRQQELGNCLEIQIDGEGTALAVKDERVAGGGIAAVDRDRNCARRGSYAVIAIARVDDNRFFARQAEQLAVYGDSRAADTDVVVVVGDTHRHRIGVAQRIDVERLQTLERNRTGCPYTDHTAGVAGRIDHQGIGVGRAVGRNLIGHSQTVDRDGFGASKVDDFTVDVNRAVFGHRG